MAISSRVLLDEQTLPSTQIYMKRWYPACSEACWKLRRNNLSPNSILYRYIQGWFTHSQTDKQAHIMKKQRETKAKMNRCWYYDPCFIPCNSLSGRSWKTLKGDDKGFDYGSNTYFINASCKKLKHDRSNTGLNAFSSFPIFPFSTYPSGVRALLPPS